jgi:hypothetical protein
MSPRFRPPGKTFKERWPQEAEETRYFAATTYAVVVGGVLGAILLPFGICHTFVAVPVLAPLIVGLVALVTIALTRSGGPGRRWLALAWKIGVWVLAAGALGFAVEGLIDAMCDDACRLAMAEGRSRSPVMLTYALLVAGSAGSAILADRWGNALRHRAPG